MSVCGERESWNDHMRGFLPSAVFGRWAAFNPDLLDMHSLLDELRADFSVILNAVDARSATEIVIDLYKWGSGPDEIVSDLFQACQWTDNADIFSRASGKIASELGFVLPELLSDALDPRSEHEAEAIGLVLQACQSAIDGRSLAAATVSEACQDVLRSIRDPETAELLCEGMKEATGCEERRAAAVLLECVAEATELVDDPWSVVEDLTAGLRSLSTRKGETTTIGMDTAVEVLLSAFADAAGEHGDSHFLWESFQHLQDERGGSEWVEALWNVYPKTIQAVVDPRPLLPIVFQVLDSSIREDCSEWLPDRLQATEACCRTIEAVVGRLDADGAIVAMEKLLDATMDAVEMADSPTAAIEVLLEGLSFPSPSPPEWMRPPFE